MRFIRAIRVPCLIAAVLAARLEAAAAADVKIAPDTIAVIVDAGKGAAPFTITGATSRPDSMTVLDATGAATLLPHSDIRPTIDSQASPRVLLGHVDVATSVALDSSVTYMTRLILHWKDNTTKDVALTIRSTALSFQVPDKFDVILDAFEPASKRLLVKNTGKATIDRVEVASDTLTTGDGRHHTEFTRQTFALRLPAPASIDVDVAVPEPRFAGTYTGALHVTGRDGAMQVVPASLKTRGPNLFPASPLVLFIVTIAAGALLSWTLEGWFAGGGLRRAEAIRTLRISQSDIAALLTHFQQLSAANVSVQVPNSVQFLTVAQGRASAALQQINTNAIDQIVLDADAAAAAAAGGKQLRTAVDISITLFPAPGNLQPAVTALDAVAMPQNSAVVQAYATALTTSLQTTRAAAGGAAGAAGGAAIAVQPQSVQDIDRNIAFMARLQQCVIAIVVVLGAYVTLYATSVTFGALTDYINAFFWALGLTQTGSQILQRVRK